MLTNVESFPSGKILLRSREYIQLGCDLRDLKGLTESFAEVVDIDEALLLFVAEVSITYMALKRADALIEWARALPFGKPRPSMESMGYLTFISTILSPRANHTIRETASLCANDASSFHNAADTITCC